MKNTMLLFVSALLLFSASLARADEIDPEQAILGSWVIDQIELARMHELETDDAIKESMKRMRWIFDTKSFDFYRDGRLVISGTGVRGIVNYEIDDDGVLHISAENMPGYYPGTALFSSNDNFQTLPRPEGKLSYSAPFRRFFSIETLEGESQHQPTIDRLMGTWRLDEERLIQMDWIVAIKDPERRAYEIDNIKDGDGKLHLRITSDRLFMIDPNSGDVEDIASIIIGADEHTVAIGIFDRRGSDIPSLIARIDVFVDDHIEIWEDGRPLPMLRVIEDVIHEETRK